MEFRVVVFDRRIGVLEAVAREHADHRGAEGHLLAALDQPGHGSGAGRFTEDPFATAQQLVGLDDLGVGHSHESALAFALGFQGVLLVHRVADADGRGDRVGLLHGVAEHHRRRPGGLEAHHAGQGAAAAGGLVLLETHPIGADVAGVAHGDAEPIRRISQGIHHLKGGGFLALEPERVERVHQGDRVGVGHLAHDRQGPVEVALHGQDFGAVEQGLGQLALGHVAIGNQHKGPHAGPAGIGRRRSGGVAGAGADHGLRAGFAGLADRHGHAPILEGTGGIKTVVLEEHLHPPADPLRDHRRRDQRGCSLAQGDHRRGCRNGQPGPVGLDQAWPVLHHRLGTQAPEGGQQRHGQRREGWVESTAQAKSPEGKGF